MKLSFALLLAFTVTYPLSVAAQSQRRTAWESICELAAGLWRRPQGPAANLESPVKKIPAEELSIDGMPISKLPPDTNSEPLPISLKSEPPATASFFSPESLIRFNFLRSYYPSLEQDLAVGIAKRWNSSSLQDESALQSQLTDYVARKLRGTESSLLKDQLPTAIKDPEWTGFINVHLRERLAALAARIKESPAEMAEAFESYHDERIALDPDYAHRAGGRRFSKTKINDAITLVHFVLQRAGEYAADLKPLLGLKEILRQRKEEAQNTVADVKIPPEPIDLQGWVSRLCNVDLAAKFLDLYEEVLLKPQTGEWHFSSSHQEILKEFISRLESNEQSQDELLALIDVERPQIVPWAKSYTGGDSGDASRINSLVVYLEPQSYDETEENGGGAELPKDEVQNAESLLAYFAPVIQFHPKAIRELKGLDLLGSKFMTKLFYVFEDVSSDTPLKSWFSMVNIGPKVYEIKLVHVGVHYRILFRQLGHQKPQVIYIGKREGLNSINDRQQVGLRLRSFR